jgi:hypothetical protein
VIVLFAKRFKNSSILNAQSAMTDRIDLVEMHRRREETIGRAMRAFIKRLLMHYGIYRRYPLPRLSAFRNAWRNARA